MKCICGFILFCNAILLVQAESNSRGVYSAGEINAMESWIDDLIKMRGEECEEEMGITYENIPKHKRQCFFNCVGIKLGIVGPEYEIDINRLEVLRKNGHGCWLGPYYICIDQQEQCDIKTLSVCDPVQPDWMQPSNQNSLISQHPKQSRPPSGSRISPLVLDVQLVDNNNHVPQRPTQSRLPADNQHNWSNLVPKHPNHNWHLVGNQIVDQNSDADIEDIQYEGTNTMEQCMEEFERRGKDTSPGCIDTCMFLKLGAMNPDFSLNKEILLPMLDTIILNSIETDLFLNQSEIIEQCKHVATDQHYCNAWSVAEECLIHYHYNPAPYFNAPPQGTYQFPLPSTLRGPPKVPLHGPLQGPLQDTDISYISFSREKGPLEQVRKAKNKTCNMKHRLRPDQATILDLPPELAEVERTCLHELQSKHLVDQGCMDTCVAMRIGMLNQDFSLKVMEFNRNGIGTVMPMVIPHPVLYQCQNVAIDKPYCLVSHFVMDCFQNRMTRRHKPRDPREKLPSPRHPKRRYKLEEKNVNPCHSHRRQKDRNSYHRMKHMKSYHITQTSKTNSRNKIPVMNTDYDYNECIEDMKNSNGNFM